MTALNFIKEKITALNINYDYKEWTAEEKPKLYFIGEELKEVETADNATTSTLKIVSHNSGGFKDFFEAVNKIKTAFPKRKPLVTETEKGSFCVSLGKCDIIPPEKEGERTRAEITLVIREMKTSE